MLHMYYCNPLTLKAGCWCLLGKLRKEEMVPHANAFGEKVLLRPTRGPLGNASSLSLAPKSSWRRAKLRHKTQDKNSVYFDY